MRNVKIFISSPIDLSDSRSTLVALFHELNDRPTIRERYKFSPYIYERDALALSGKGPQDIVNETMLKPSETDLVICMLWARFGTEIPGSFNPNTRSPYGSGTEFEYYDAYRANQKSGKPDLLLYRCIAPPPENADPKQISKVTEFFGRFSGKQPMLKGLYHEFSSSEDLRKIVSQDVEILISKWEHARERSAKRIVSIALPILGIISIFIVIVASLLFNATPPLENSPFNIAFAGFIVDSDTNIPPADIEILTEAFYKDLKTRVGEVQSELPLTVGIWSPQQVGSVTGVDKEARAVSAAALVTRLKTEQNAQADMVIYGIIREQSGQVMVVPEFFVANTWPEISEVYGRFELAAALYSPTINQSRALSGELSTRSQTLLYIIQGISQYIVQQYDAAKRTFDLALEVNGDAQGGELIYVLRGNVSLSDYNRITSGGSTEELRQRPALLNDAQADFEEAIKHNSDYSRGYIGLGSVSYLRLFDSAEGNWNNIAPSMIDGVETIYELALEAHDRPESADITTKVAFGLGQVFLLRKLQGDSNAGEQAEKYFLQVITDYNNGKNPRVQELASEANSRIALLASKNGDYEQARLYYQQAITLTTMNERRKVFERRLLEIEIEERQIERDIPGAISAYDKLLSLDMRPVERGILLFRKGKMLSEDGDDQAALETYQAAVKLDLRDDPKLAAQLWVELGDRYYALGRLEDSIAAYEEALKLDPGGQAHLTRLVEETKAEIGTPVSTSAR